MAETYDLLGTLEDDGEVTVYDVRHRLLEDRRIIKVLPAPPPDSERRQRFLEAAQHVSGLQHAHLVKLLDFHLDDSWAFMVKEYLHGVTLTEVIARCSPPPLELGIEVALQGLDALAFLHARGFCHRGVAPGQLLLGRGERGGPDVHWLDAGLGSFTKPPVGAGSEGIYIGKVRYAAPEHFGGEGADGLAGGCLSDVYMFGLVLYEWLTGQYPIAGQQATSIIAGHLFRPPLSFDESDPSDRIPSGLREVLLKALAKEPAERFCDAQDLRQALLPWGNRDRSETLAARHWLDGALNDTSEGIGAAEAQLKNLVRETEQAARLEEAQKRRQEEIGKQASKIGKLLDAGRLVEARGALGQVGERYGQDARLSDLWQRLERQETPTAGGGSHPQSGPAGSSIGDGLSPRVEEKVEDLVARARSLSQTEDFAEAQRLLQQAIHLVPDHQDAQTLVQSIKKLLSLQDRESRRYQQLGPVVQEIRRLLSQRRPGEALQQLQKAIARFGDLKELQELRHETARAFLYGDSDLDTDLSGDFDSEDSMNSSVDADNLVESVSPPSDVVEHPPPPPIPAPPSVGVETITTAPPPVPEPMAGSHHQGAVQVAPHMSPNVAPVAIQGLGDLPLGGGPAPAADILEVPLAGGAEPALPPPQPESMTPEELPDPMGVGNSRPAAAWSSPWFWAVVVLVVVLFLLLGLWMAPKGEKQPTKPSIPPIEDVRWSLGVLADKP